jgi:hypothetical protein
MQLTILLASFKPFDWKNNYPLFLNLAAVRGEKDLQDRTKPVQSIGFLCHGSGKYLVSDKKNKNAV